MLTGDKQETAINIGFACHQLTENMAQLIIEGECEEVCTCVCVASTIRLLYDSRISGLVSLKCLLIRAGWFVCNVC